MGPTAVNSRRGLDMVDITTICSSFVAGCSFRPSCSSSAVKIDGASPASGAASAPGRAVTAVVSVSA